MPAAPYKDSPAPIALAIHGGAGALRRGDIGPELERAYRAALRAALDAGFAVLAAGGPSLNAVETAVGKLEDCPLFNAGRGAALNRDGVCELDASIMDGRTLAAGAAAAVRGVRNPIRLARAVMEHGAHVFLVGGGAEEFARSTALPFEPEDYFITSHRRSEFDLAQTAQNAGMTASPDMENVHPDAPPTALGTVGAVALDRRGNLAAGTSTGGITNKYPGRVGDSPVIGAGVYANDRTCAVSATGQGEYFVRAVAAHDVSALMEYRGLPVNEAAAETLRKIAALGGSGGLIALDGTGQVTLPFNTPGMYRACRSASPASIFVAIFGDE